MRRIAVATLLFLAICTPCQAEDPLRGRLPDGRAFRTDLEGNQLVDYIAELEVTIETLNRQVHGLQYELEQKQARLERVSTGSADSGIIEKNLIGSVNNTAAPSRVKVIDCSQQITPLKQKVVDLEASLEIEKRVADEQASDLRSELKRLRATFAGSKQNSKDANSQLKSAFNKIDELEEYNQKLSSEVAGLKLALQNNNDRLQLTEKSLSEGAEKLKVADSQVAELKLALNRSESSSSNANQPPAASDPTARAALYSAGPAKSYRSKSLITADSLAIKQQQQINRVSAAKRQALDSLRPKLNSDLNKLRGVIATRDKLYTRYKKTGGPVSISPRQMVSSRKLGIDQIRSRIKQASSITELSRLTRDIKEIKSVATDDIALVKRLLK